MLQAEIQALGERLCHASSSDHSLSDHTLSDHTISGHTISDHTHILEILQKELAAHKEMVTELRAQLVEKDTELQVQGISRPSVSASLSPLTHYFNTFFGLSL